ncbi:MAG: YjbE family putative metal transport protein [Acidobacteria bacterium]|nr:YjbE family putative metal transport protein [Acidobacteriota bacterium]
MLHGPSYRFLLDSLSIVIIDLLLAGDNALVIAMAVRSLNARERKIGIGFGAAAAVALRVAITIAAARLLTIEFIKLAGGALILWIAVKVFSDNDEAKGGANAPARFWQAIWFIVAADITMSTDNILAVAGASHGNAALIVFGLCLSIPFVVLSSSLLSKLMDRYNWVMYLGAAILGKVGGEMIATDPYVERTLRPTEMAVHGAEAGSIALIFAAVLAIRMTRKTAED